MSPRVLAGFYIHQIDKDIKKCKQILPHKDPIKYAQAQYQYIFVTEMDYMNKKNVKKTKRQMFYLFVNLEDARSRIEKIEGVEPCELSFFPIESVASSPRSPRSPGRQAKRWSWEDMRTEIFVFDTSVHVVRDLSFSLTTPRHYSERENSVSRSIFIAQTLESIKRFVCVSLSSTVYWRFHLLV